MTASDKIAIGDRFGRLVVHTLNQRHKDGSPAALCACDCGNQHLVKCKSLRSGATRSCGCLRRDLARSRVRRTYGIIKPSTRFGDALEPDDYE